MNSQELNNFRTTNIRLLMARKRAVNEGNLIKLFVAVNYA